MASSIDHLEVTHVGQRYRVVMHARMDTTAARAYAVFTDYARLPEINDAILSAQPVAGAQEGAQRLRTQVRICVFRFCWVLEQVQDMRKRPPEHLSADVIPDLSNLRYGKASWRIWDDAGRAQLTFEAVVEPDFWVPPLIGPWVIERKLRQEAIDTANGIERIANNVAAEQPAGALEAL